MEAPRILGRASSNATGISGNGSNVNNNNNNNNNIAPRRWNVRHGNAVLPRPCVVRA